MKLKTKKPLEIRIFNRECLEKLDTLMDNSIDMICCDLPYGTTQCKWDSIIDLQKMWQILDRVCKKDCVMVFTAQHPFTYKLIESNFKDFKYSLIWEKPNSSSPFDAKRRPMKNYEDILVFCKGKGIYNPQMEEGKPYKWSSKRSGGEASNLSNNIDEEINNEGTRFPKSILRFKQERGYHPTQKPVALMEWLINTYSNENDTVLDMTMGSGTTGVACVNTNRNFVGIELDTKYFDISRTRMLEVLI